MDVQSIEQKPAAPLTCATMPGLFARGFQGEVTIPRKDRFRKQATTTPYRPTHSRHVARSTKSEDRAPTLPGLDLPASLSRTTSRSRIAAKRALTHALVPTPVR